MKRRFIAHWFLGGSNHDCVRANSLKELVPFVKSRIYDTTHSSGGISICVADLQSHLKESWLWRMQSGGNISTGRSKYAKDAATLFGTEGANM